MSTLAYAAQDSAAMVGRNLRRTLRSPDTMIMTFAIPVTILLMFVYVFGGAMNVGGAYIDYVVPGIVLLCAGFGSGSTAVTVATDLHTGIVDRFRAMAVSRTSVLTGHVVESVLRNLVTTGLVIAVAVAIGFRPTGDPLRWLGVVGLLACYVLALSWLAAAMGVLVSNPEAANGFMFIFMFLPYVSSAFVPVHTLPSWLRGFAEHQPVTSITETMRGLLMGTPVGSSAPTALIWCAGLALIGYVGAGILFARRSDS
ncbi:ABC transporter permease [Nocardia yunnanensis]|uniref:Transport permease protein n=1 Tax=Nocardia yunnanensis TaxID=2382165 RepID=A0A386ZKL3_9NOCA|nr:ABC transporter permease [Nocardia yunnanensis]AYF77674.1 ABC transporter permease [Nocardia yunnanensis]